LSEPLLISLLESIAARLAHVAPTKIGHPALALNERPPRYVWVPTRDRWNPRAYAGGERPARSFGGIEASFEVHIWGADYGAALSLRQKLVTAIRDELAGAYTFGDAEWRPNEVQHNGWLLVQTMTLIVPLTESDLTVAAPADRLQRTFRPTRLELEDAPAPGWLSAPGKR
jgi:hypothetical protein